MSSFWCCWVWRKRQCCGHSKTSSWRKVIPKRSLSIPNDPFQVLIENSCMFRDPFGGSHIPEGSLIDPDPNSNDPSRSQRILQISWFILQSYKDEPLISRLFSILRLFAFRMPTDPSGSFWMFCCHFGH